MHPLCSRQKLLLEGEIGDIVSIRTEEKVSYHHIPPPIFEAVGVTRICAIPFSWQMQPRFGFDYVVYERHCTGSCGSFDPGYFKPENAPEGSGTRCLVDCRIERECPYSAYNNYIEKGLWRAYAWESIEHYGESLTEEMKIESLKKDNPFGRCVWHCDNNVVDRQTVIIEFENGVVATHTLSTPASKPCRTVQIIGTKGEIEGISTTAYWS